MNLHIYFGFLRYSNHQKGKPWKTYTKIVISLMLSLMINGVWWCLSIFFRPYMPLQSGHSKSWNPKRPSCAPAEPSFRACHHGNGKSRIARLSHSSDSEACDSLSCDELRMLTPDMTNWWIFFDFSEKSESTGFQNHQNHQLTTGWKGETKTTIEALASQMRHNMPNRQVSQKASNTMLHRRQLSNSKNRCQGTTDQTQRIDTIPDM